MTVDREVRGKMSAVMLQTIAVMLQTVAVILRGIFARLAPPLS